MHRTWRGNRSKGSERGDRDSWNQHRDIETKREIRASEYGIDKKQDQRRGGPRTYQPKMVK